MSKEELRNKKDTALAEEELEKVIGGTGDSTEKKSGLGDEDLVNLDSPKGMNIRGVISPAG